MKSTRLVQVVVAVVLCVAQWGCSSARPPMTVAMEDRPVVAEGIDETRVASMKSSGWKAAATRSSMKGVDMGFAAPDLPGGFTILRTNVVPGTPYIYNPATGQAIARGCGNPTCWRWLEATPTSEIDGDIVRPMQPMGVYDPSRDPLKVGGLTSEDKAVLEEKGWKRAVTKVSIAEIDVGFRDNSVPSGFILRNVSVPAGTEYYFNRKTGEAILAGGANPAPHITLVGG